jgi:hypothetical protein
LVPWWPKFVEDGSAYMLRGVNKELMAATKYEITGAWVTLGQPRMIRAAAGFHRTLPKLSKLSIGGTAMPATWSALEDAVELNNYLDTLADAGLKIKELAIRSQGDPQLNVIVCRRLAGSVETLTIPWKQCCYEPLPQYFTNLRQLKLCSMISPHRGSLAKLLRGLDLLEVLTLSCAVTTEELVELTCALPKLNRLGMHYLAEGSLERAAGIISREVGSIGTLISLCGSEEPLINPCTKGVCLDEIGHWLQVLPALREMRGRFKWSQEPTENELDAFCADDRARSVFESMGL